jgi:hypothetical protein
MSDIENRLADIERRLQRLELVGPLHKVEREADRASEAPLNSTLRNLVFWIGLIILGVVIWIFSADLAISGRPR